ncbi:ABC transporter permease [Ekhidna sp. To15]|uniref:ABC transporter permease n=1 Tax=Ekhidna sp. To15 TaxID=3395267 RepID=UPI003F524D66
MDQWLTFPWLETFTMSVLILGGLTGFLLIGNKYPSGRWLGLLTLAYLCAFGSKQFENPSITLIFIVPAAVSFFLYCNAFFFQKKRIKVVHLMPVLVMVGVLFAAIDVSLLKASAGLLVIAYVGNVLKLMLDESRSRGFSYFLNPGGRIAWFRNFAAFNLVFLAIFFLELGTLIYSILFLVYLAQILYQIFNESSFFTAIPIGNKYKKSTLNPAIKSAILEKLEAIMDKNKFYQRDDASLSSLAEELGATTHHLSQVLNESLKISFQDLLARYRVRAACRMLRQQEYEQVKIENIATIVGYNSKSAFNTAFKKRIGLTPSDYRSAKNVLTYGEERLTERKAPQGGRGAFDLNHVFNLKMKRDMILNFLKIFVRNLKRNSFFSLINIFGLTVGFVCSIFIYLFIANELSYDKDIPDADRVYRITWLGENPQTRTPHPMAQAIVEDWPEIESAVSISPWYGPGLSKESVRVKNPKTNVLFEEPDFFFTDSTFFDVFDIEILEGDVEALTKPFSLIITDEMARKYFGDSSAVGRELELNDMPIMVTTVVKGMPKNSHFHFNAIIPYITLKQINPNDSWMTWADFGHFNYIKTKPGVDHLELQSKIPEWVAPYLGWSQERLDGLMEGTIGYFGIQPITDIHLTSHLRWELENNGNILYVYILTATLIFLLAIAGINYVNLTTAKSLERAKEIGVRKTLGAVSTNLTMQFYLESIIFCLMALIFSLGISYLLLDGFNFLSGKNFSVDSIFNPTFLLQSFGLAVGLGLLAGFYPAIALSSFKPTEVLKGKLTTSSKGVRMRSALVVLQFTVSAILITGSLIIFRQIDYMKNKELGFDKEAVVSFNIPISVELGDIDLPTVYAVRQQIEALSGVSGTCMISNLPGDQFNQHPAYAKNFPENRIDFSEVIVDFGIEEVLGLEIVDGRMFNSSYATDTATISFVINEVAAKQLNLERAVGEQLVWVDNDTTYEGQIIGVVKDFHYRSLHSEIQPLLMVVDPYGAGHVVVKLDGKEFGRVMGEMEKIYSQLNSELPFEYYFLDKQLGELYQSEIKTLNIFSVFTGIAVALACLGLLGMAIATLNHRIKEVGMRKILGASSTQIMRMILGQFVKLVAVALIIGLPLSYLFMQSWVSEFSYQAPFGIMPFISASLALLAVALLSVSSAVAKITFSNPSDSLRYE